MSNILYTIIQSFWDCNIFYVAMLNKVAIVVLGRGRLIGWKKKIFFLLKDKASNEKRFLDVEGSKERERDSR